MPQPTPYEPSFSFTDFSSESPSGQPPGVSIDAELAAIKLTLDDILANLVLIQRDDGELENEIVSVDSLSAAVAALIAA
jgi:hypothetical protein